MYVILNTFPDKIRRETLKHSGQEENRALTERGWSLELNKNGSEESYGSVNEKACVGTGFWNNKDEEA